MTALRSALYVGHVVHKRLRPVQHAFRYRVFALALDVDEIDELSRRFRMFGRNRRRPVGFFDADVGGPGPGTAGEKIRDLLREVGLGAFGHQVTLLTYPRLWGYVFNPLSVYYCRDGGGELGATVYEVTNTFGERRSYVVPTEGRQTCRKAMYVSPFTGTPATYKFFGHAPDDTAVVGVTLTEQEGPTLKTHFAGERRPISDGALAATIATHPLMTVKVMTAIHVEAARLWWKGVPLVTRHVSPQYSFVRVGENEGAIANVWR